MNTHSSHDGSSDPDAALDEFFRVQALAPDDFASRTIVAARADARRKRTIRFRAWTSGLAASFALLLGLVLWQDAGEEPGLKMAAPPAEVLPASPSPSPSAEDLTLALHEAISRQDVVFYGQALALEDLLADTRALTEEESRDTLDFLILLAGN